MKIGDLIFYEDFSIDPHHPVKRHCGIIVKFNGKFNGAKVIIVFTKNRLLPFFDYELSHK